MDEFEKLDKYLKRLAPLIGYLVIEFNSLEETLDKGIIETFSDRVDDIGYAVISGMSFTAKVELLDRLLGPIFEAVNSPVWSKRLVAIVSQLKEAAGKRNDMIHAAWSEYNLETSTVRTKTKLRKHALEVLEKKIQPSDIRKAIGFTKSVNNKLFHLCDARERWWA